MKFLATKIEGKNRKIIWLSSDICVLQKKGDPNMRTGKKNGKRANFSSFNQRQQSRRLETTEAKLRWKKIRVAKKKNVAQLEERKKKSNTKLRISDRFFLEHRKSGGPRANMVNRIGDERRKRRTDGERFPHAPPPSPPQIRRLLCEI